MRLQGGRTIMERKDEGEQASTDWTLGRCFRTAPKGSAKGTRKQGGVCTRSDKSGGEKSNCCKKGHGCDGGGDDDGGAADGARSMVWPQRPTGKTLRLANAD